MSRRKNLGCHKVWLYAFYISSTTGSKSHMKSFCVRVKFEQTLSSFKSCKDCISLIELFDDI